MSLPTITTYNVGEKGPFTLQCKGNISNNGDSTIKRRGFVYDLSSKSAPGNVRPELSGYSFFADEKGSFINGEFDIYLSNLSKNSTYYIRAFCQNKEGFSYGEEIFADTLPNYYPVLYYPIRARENKEGINYKPSDPKKLFSVDLQNYDNEVYNIEHELGLSPRGSDATVRARLDRLDAAQGWKFISGGSFTNSINFIGRNGDSEETYKIVMRGYRSTNTNVWLRFNGSSSSRYSYHNGVRGYAAGSLVNIHSYSKLTTGILMNRTAFAYFWLDAIINVKRNGFVSVNYKTHSRTDGDNYEFTQGDGLYNYVTSNITSLNFIFTGTLDSGSYRLYKLV
jgi:hypothetical protein